MDLNFRINLLKISYLIQIVFLIIILMINIFYKRDIIWINSLLNTCFLILMIILFLLTIHTVASLIITFIKETYKIFAYLLKITIIFIIISFIYVIGSIILFYFTNKSYPSFYRNCPFNYNISDAENLFTNFEMNKNKLFELKEICENRRCFYQNKIYDIDEEGIMYKYSYLCNYNSSDDFKYELENIIICENLISKDKDIFESQQLIKYINLCNSLIDLYICKTVEAPKKYDIKSDYICPKKSVKSITLEIIIIVLNVILSNLIYIIQYIYYNKILKIIVTGNVRRTLDDPRNENGRTIDTSKKSGLNQDNNSFKKEQTQIIVIGQEPNNDEIFHIYNRDKKNKNKIAINVNNKKPESFMNKSFLSINHNFNEESKKKDDKMGNQDKNRSCTDINSNRLFYGKNDLFNSLRIMTQVDNMDKNSDKESNKIKFITIKK